MFRLRNSQQHSLLSSHFILPLPMTLVMIQWKKRQNPTPTSFRCRVADLVEQRKLCGPEIAYVITLTLSAASSDYLIFARHSR